MNAPSSLEKRTAPGGGPSAEAAIESKKPLSSAHCPALQDVEACLEAAVECERLLARKQYRLRQFICNLMVYESALRNLGKAVWRDAA